MSLAKKALQKDDMSMLAKHPAARGMSRELKQPRLVWPLATLTTRGFVMMHRHWVWPSRDTSSPQAFRRPPNVVFYGVLSYRPTIQPYP